MITQENIILLEALQYIAVVLGTIFAVVQFLSVKKARRQEKAASVMLRYRDTVLKIGAVEAAISANEKITEVINKIDQTQPLSFALYEHKKYGISAKDEKIYKDYLLGTDILSVHRKINGKKVTLEDLIPDDIRSSIPKVCTIYQLAAMTLNEVEHICMEIESGVVDDKYVYGALHQTLLPFIHTMAISMQAMNKAALPDENYYSYTRKLYRSWVVRQSKNYKRMERRLRVKSTR